MREPHTPPSELACLEWPRESGCLKKESGSFLILMGREDGCLADLLGFITALKRASSSVCESPRTCTICCPAGGAPRCASMSPKVWCRNKSSSSQTVSPLSLSVSAYSCREKKINWRNHSREITQTDSDFRCKPPPKSLLKLKKKKKHKRSWRK